MTSTVGPFAEPSLAHESAGESCPHCHEYLDDELAAERERALRPRPNTGMAAILCFFIPGLGQLYKGQVVSGLMWFTVTHLVLAASVLTAFCGIGIAGIPVLIVLKLLCVFDAASGGN